MIIQGLTLDGGFQLDPPPPSKFLVADPNFNNIQGAVLVFNSDGSTPIQITASDGTGDRLFGFSAAIKGPKVAVGSPWNNTFAGAVYVYNTDGTGEVIVEASDGAASDQFGDSVAMSNTKIVVGSPYDDDRGGQSGSAYVYNTDGTGEVKIVASDGSSNDQYGHSVAISDTKVAVSAPWHGTNYEGAVYVYNTDGTGQTIIQGSYNFGNLGKGKEGLAITDQKLLVGSSTYNGNRGRAYIYNIDGSGQITLAGSNTSGGRFGISVAISDSKIVIGEPGDNQTAQNSGAVYIYNLDGTGKTKIKASDAFTNSGYGTSVSISEDKIYVGAPTTINGESAVYIYNLDGTGEQKIASPGNPYRSFGDTVACDS